VTVPDSTAAGATTGASQVHRLLDEALSEVTMTPERQDLKEEIRADLLARVAELRGQGVPAAVAARRAVDGLGDLRALVEEVDPDVVGARPERAGGTASARWAERQRQHRVRPRPAFLVRTVLLGAVGVAGLAVVALAVWHDDVPLGGRLAAVVAVALVAAALTTDALRQETTSNYPMPAARAGGYGAALGLGLLAVGTGWQDVPERAAGWLVAAVVPLLAGIVLGTVLGSTQTNRHKAWVLEVAAEHAHVGDRFTRDPEAAARFGIYTAVTWVVAATAFVALTLTVGWAWSWTALVAALATSMLTLARMLFGPSPADSTD